MKCFALLIMFLLIDYMTKSEEMMMVMQRPSQYRANNIKCVLNFLITIGVDFGNKHPKQILKYSNEIIACNERMNKSRAQSDTYNAKPNISHVVNSSNKLSKPLLISFYNIHKSSHQRERNKKQNESVKFNNYRQRNPVQTKDFDFFYYKYYFLFYYMVDSISFPKQYYEHLERLNSIKIIILNSLGLESKPNVTVRASRKATGTANNRSLKEKYFFKSEKYTSTKSLKKLQNTSPISTKIYLTKYKYVMDAKSQGHENKNAHRNVYEFFKLQEMLFYSAKGKF